MSVGNTAFTYLYLKPKNFVFHLIWNKMHTKHTYQAFLFFFRMKNVVDQILISYWKLERSPGKIQSCSIKNRPLFLQFLLLRRCIKKFKCFKVCWFCVVFGKASINKYLSGSRLTFFVIDSLLQNAFAKFNSLLWKTE